MAQVKAKETKQVFFSGVTSTIIEGTLYDSESAIVKANPSLFDTAVVTKEAKTVKFTEEVKAPELKEELLIEAPVAALEVTEVVETAEVVVAPVVTKKGNKK